MAPTSGRSGRRRNGRLRFPRAAAGADLRRRRHARRDRAPAPRGVQRRLRGGGARLALVGGRVRPAADDDGRQGADRYARERGLDAASWRSPSCTGTRTAAMRRCSRPASRCGPESRRCWRRRGRGGPLLAVATTTTPANVDALVRAALGTPAAAVFEVIAAGDAVAAKKPAPDVYLLALAGLGLGGGVRRLRGSAQRPARGEGGRPLTVVTPSRSRAARTSRGPTGCSRGLAGSRTWPVAPAAG